MCSLLDSCASASAILRRESGGVGAARLKCSLYMDNLSAAERSHCMSHVLGRNTTPELTIRRLLHSMGFRYRVHVRTLPGTPDLVFASRRKVILIHGCFWHGHSCRAGRNTPASNVLYWTNKLRRNRNRDRRTETKLKRLGWRVLKVWECEIRTDKANVIEKIVQFLGPHQHQ